MKKLKYILILSLLMVPFGCLQAAGSGNDVTLDEDINISLTSPAMTLVLGASSTFYTMTVTASTVTFVVSPGGKVMLTSNDRYNLKPNITANITDTCTSSYARVIYIASVIDTGDSTIVFSPAATVCDASSSSTSSSSGSQGGSAGPGGGTTTPTTITTVTTPAVSKTVAGVDGGTMETSDSKAGLTIPENLASGNVSMAVTPKASSSYTVPSVNSAAVASQVYDYTLSVGGVSLTQFTKSVTLTFKYSESDISGINEDTLKVYYWDAANSNWVAVGGTLDKANNTITAEVSHLTIFGVFGDKTVAGLEGGQLIKIQCPSGKVSVNHVCKSVYYLGSDNKRYVFPNEVTYKSWYADFSAVKSITSDAMATYALGGNVTMRPGTYLVKITTDPKVYAVESGGKLRWVESETVAKNLYSDNWIKKIVDVSDAFFVNYNATTAVSNKVADQHPEGSVIKYAGSNDRYYIITNGVKRLFKNTALSDNGFQEKFVIETSIVYPIGADILGTENALKTTAGP